MIRLLLAFVLILPLSLSAQRQKKNVIKPACLGLDFLAEPPATNEAYFLFYSFEYERQFSPRTSFNVSYIKFIHETKGIENPVNVPSGATYRPGRFSESLWGVGYESRFYFNDFETDGTSSGYISFNYQYLRGTQNSTEAYYIDNGVTTPVLYPEQYNTIHRPGIKLGHVWQGALYSDLYFGVLYNIQNTPAGNWQTPEAMLPVSLIAGWNIGIPF